MSPSPSSSRCWDAARPPLPPAALRGAGTWPGSVAPGGGGAPLLPGPGSLRPGGPSPVAPSLSDSLETLVHTATQHTHRQIKRNRSFPKQPCLPGALYTAFPLLFGSGTLCRSAPLHPLMMRIRQFAKAALLASLCSVT